MQLKELSCACELGFQLELALLSAKVEELSQCQFVAESRGDLNRKLGIPVEPFLRLDRFKGGERDIGDTPALTCHRLMNLMQPFVGGKKNKNVQPLSYQPVCQVEES